MITITQLTQLRIKTPVINILNKSSISFACVAMLFFCSGCFTSSKKGDLQLFSASQGVVWITDTSDTGTPPRLRIRGRWDLSGAKRVRVVLTNGSLHQGLNATIEMTGNEKGPEVGYLLSQKTIKVGEQTEWLVAIPPQPKDPGIIDMLKGMHATPFTMAGVVSSLDLQHVTEIAISFQKSLKGARLGIKEITLVGGPPVQAPEWTKLQRNEFFPFIDKYGQFSHKDWPGKTQSDADLESARLRELEELGKHPGPMDRSPYGGWLEGGRQQATGNFYVTKVDGQWWMVDPEGYLFWSHGVVRVTPSSAVTPIDDRANYFAHLPDTTSPFGEFYKTRDEFLYPYYKAWGIKQTFDFSASNLRLKYGENWRDAFRDMIYRRLKSWGMNTISAGSDSAIYRSLPIPYCDRLELGTPKIEGAPPHLNVIRDPFHPHFETALDAQLRSRKQELRSPWCYGYFIDNKLVWGADEDLGRWVLKSPESQPSKHVFIRHLEDKYRTIGALNMAWKSPYKSWGELLASQVEPPESSRKDCADFSAVLIEEYFKKVAHVMRQAAPGKLYLGCRYVSVNERVLRIAAKYCDVLTFDLFVDSLSDFSLPHGIDRPVLIGEFHFGALDRGLFHPGLNQKANQEERGLAYERYVRSALANPCIIGTAWHQFSDQATTGRFDGENFQDGLTDVCDRVYPETIAKVREIGSELYRIRANQQQ